MTKTELVEYVSDKLDVKKDAVRVILDSCLDEMQRALYDGDVVKLRGFGRFKVVQQKNHKYITFKTSKNVKTKMATNGQVSEVR